MSITPGMKPGIVALFDKPMVTVTTPHGDSSRENGRVRRDGIYFSQTPDFGDNSDTLNYAGKVNGDTVKFTREAGGGSQNFTAYRGQ